MMSQKKNAQVDSTDCVSYLLCFKLFFYEGFSLVKSAEFVDFVLVLTPNFNLLPTRGSLVFLC